MDALLQHDPGALEPPDEAVERLVSRGPDMGMKPEEAEREHAVALAKGVKTAAVNGLSAEGRARLREILDQRSNAFQRGLRGDPPARVEPLTVTFKPEQRWLRREGVYTHPPRLCDWRHEWEPWSRSG